MLAYFIIDGGVGQADLPRFRDSGLYCIPVCLGSVLLVLLKVFGIQTFFTKVLE